MTDADRPTKPRLLLFAFGDFAFNLFWQSIMLFLLFYYTDTLNLPIGVAATTYMVAAVWDGIANFLAGIAIDRQPRALRFGRLIAIGALPLGLCFVLAYLPPAGSGIWAITSIFVTHIVFRTAYAAVNVPYLAMSARISTDSSDRAFVAGTRMLFGTGAAVIVALCTIPIGRSLMGPSTAQIYFAAAVVFAAIGSTILLIVGATYREEEGIKRPHPSNIRTAMLSLLRNRAFVTLNSAMIAMIIAVTVLGKSVLYYFKYVLNNPDAGQQALASISAVSAVAIPLWMFAGRYLGLKTLWMTATTLSMFGLAAFALSDIRTPAGVQIFLIGMQAIIVGMHFTFWAMLPNTIEYGEVETGLHVEGVVFGVAALLQRVGIGIATAILGWNYASAGYVPNVEQSNAALANMRTTVAIVPMIFLALSSIAMLFNPLGRGAHRRIVRELASEAP